MAEKVEDGKVIEFLAECTVDALEKRHHCYCQEVASLEEFLTRPRLAVRQPTRLARYQDLKKRLLPQVQRAIILQQSRQEGLLA